MQHFTYEETVSLLEAQVAKRGADYVYPNWRSGCSYTRDGEGDCIVGCALIDAGVPVERFVDGGNRIGIYADRLLEQLENEGLVSFDADSVRLLFDVQLLQDRGTSWGRAMTLATGRVDRRL